MRYQSLGFVKETGTLGVKGRINGLSDFEESMIDPSRIEYLDRIVELCEREDVKLFFVIPPLTQSTPLVSKGYGEAWSYFNSYAKEKNIYYDDLNLVKNRDEVFPDDMMSGMEHVGGELAGVVSNVYADILCEHLQGMDSEYLYSEYDEMVKELPPIVGWELYTEPLDENEGRIMKTRLVAKENVKPEYSFIVKNPNGEFVLQDFSEQSECILPADKIVFPLTLELRIREEDGTVLETHLDIDETTWE